MLTCSVVCRDEHYEAWCEARLEALEARSSERKRAWREWREANPEREYDRAYRKVNRERVNERKRAWHWANREWIIERKRAYREANREQIRAWQRKLRQEQVLSYAALKELGVVLPYFLRTRDQKRAFSLQVMKHFPGALVLPASSKEKDQ